MNKRKNFYIRLQPNVNSELNEVAEWLNSKNAYEKNQLIAQALVMCYLFSARLDSGENNLIAAGLNCCNSADKHFDNIKRALYSPQELIDRSTPHHSKSNESPQYSSADSINDPKPINIPLGDVEDLFAS